MEFNRLGNCLGFAVKNCLAVERDPLAVSILTSCLKMAVEGSDVNRFRKSLAELVNPCN